MTFDKTRIFKAIRNSTLYNKKTSKIHATRIVSGLGKGKFVKFQVIFLVVIATE